MKDLIEIKNKRKEREKHFLKPDGTLLAILYDDNMHYLDHGTYQEIDPALEETEDAYINKKNEFHTSFCKQVQDHFMKMKVSNKELRFSLDGMNPVSGLLEENKVTYHNLLEHIDFVYELSNSQVKESIILHERREEPLLFYIDTDYVLELQANNKIKILDEGKFIFELEAPYIVDQQEKRSDACFYELQQTPNGYLLKLYLDQEFLNHPDTIYPVVVDPTITNKMQSNNVYDTYIFDEDMNVDCNKEDILKVGFDNYDDINKVFRTLLKFELPTIGTGYEVIDAYVNLVSHPSEIFGYVKTTPIIDVHEMNQNWNESNAKWANFHNKYDPTIVSTFKYGPSDLQGTDIILRNNQFDITSLVKKWYSGKPNYGMMLKSHNESNRPNVTVASFCSKNYTGTSATPKPLLVLTYQNQNGLENYFSYQQQGYAAGTTHVNTYNGNLTGIFELGNTIGGPNPIQLALIYNTNDVVLNHDVGYGIGYQLSHYQTLKEVKIEEENLLEYLDGDGTIHYFYKDQEKENTYVDEDGLSFTIIKEDSQYKMMDKEQNEYLFTKNGDRWYLTKTLNTKGDQTIITYNDQKKIESIKDALDQTIKVTYEENKMIITSPIDTTTLTYENGRITSLINKDGTTIFSYNEHKVLSKITDTNGKSVTYEYYASPYKMKKITEFGLNDTLGASLTFTYSFETTSVTDHKGRVNTYTFNSRGNNVGVTSLKAHEELREAFAGTNLYGDYTGAINKLTSKNATVQSVKNYLSNSSFEGDTTTFIREGIQTRAVPTNDYQPRTGKKNLIIPGNMEYQEVKQVVSVPKGSYYTFSAYIKSEVPVKLALSYQDASLESQTEFIWIDPELSYTRGEVTIYYPIDATSNLTISIGCDSIQDTHIDDVQLEQGEVASYYNILDNSDFSDGMNGWTLRSIRRNSDTDVVDIQSQGSIVTASNGTKMLKIKGAPDVENTLRREFFINGQKGDAFHLSFWYKNLGINSPFMSPSRNALIAFYPKDEDMGQGAIFSIDLNRSEEWQFFSRNYVAEYDYNKIALTIFDLQNANDLYVTNFSLFQDLENNSYVYDEKGNLTLSTQLNKEKNEFQYDKNNQLINMMDPKGANFHFEYDNKIGNRLLKAIAPNGVTNEFTYDSFGNPIITRIRNMNPTQELLETSYYIRAKGTDQYLKSDLYHKSLSFKTDTCSHDIFTLLKVGEDYRIKYSTNSSYFVTFYNNTLILTKNEDDTSLFTMIKNNNGSYSLKAKTASLYLTLDGDKIIFQEKTEENDQQQFYFETKESDEFIENHAEYTKDGRFVTKTTDSLGHTITYDVNEDNGLINSVIDAKGQTTTYTYNDKEQITKIKKNDQEVVYQYNSQDLLSNILHGTKNYQFVYDDFLNPKQVKLNNHPLITHEYEEYNGNLVSSTYANNQKIEFTYDNFDRISSVIKNNDVYHYKYDNLGNLAKVLSNHGNYRYNYDFAQRLSRYAYDQFKIDYDYDKNNQVEAATYSIEGIQYPMIYTYNDNSTLTKITYQNENINYLYDNLDRIKEVNLNDQYKTTYTYVTNGKQTSNLIKTFQTGEDTYKYQYDVLNQLTHIYKNNELIHHYEYNEYQELITDEDYIAQKTIRYTYDLYGNIQSKKEYELFTSNLLHEDTYEYHNTEWQDQLTKFNDQVITYDALGNPLTIGEDIELTWMNGRELKTYQAPEKNIEYTYDKDGIRTSKTVNNVKTMYYTENNHIVFEITPQYVIYYLQEANGDLVGFQYNNTMYYYIKNDSEDIIGILDHNYNKLASYEYDAYGNILSIKDQYGNDISDNYTHIANINPFRYRSYYYDKETNLYYLNSRYYNPVWGRFMNADGIIGANKDITSQNLYTYTSNNPINLVDLLGGFSVAVGMGLGALAAAAAAADTLVTYGSIALGFYGMAALAYDVIINWQEIQMKIQAAVQGITKTMDDVQEKLKKKSKDTRKHTVYTLENEGGIVIYVGRTVDYKSRMNAHGRKGSPREGLTPGETRDGLTYAQARGLEQSWIKLYGTLNKDNPAANQINGVRWDNPRCHEFMSIAQTFLPENETYVGYCK